MVRFRGLVRFKGLVRFNSVVKMRNQFLSLVRNPIILRYLYLIYLLILINLSLLAVEVIRSQIIPNLITLQN